MQQCPGCRRELGEGEPVYQTRLGNAWERRVAANIGYCTTARVCAECLKQIEGKWPHPPSYWRPGKPCRNCGRPVFNFAKWKEQKIIACTKLCQQTVYNTRFQARHKRTLPLRACTVCEEQFAPKRNDSIYCSDACAQRAYRLRRIRP
jgi:hypothetical protein